MSPRHGFWMLRLSLRARLKAMAASSGFLDTLPSRPPWANRAASPQRGGGGGGETSTPAVSGEKAPGRPGATQPPGGDHRINHRHRISIRDYPADCPPLNVRWFHAVDVPKRKPHVLSKSTEPPKPLAPPKKFELFSIRDSRAIEVTFQRLARGEAKQPQADAGSQPLGSSAPAEPDNLPGNARDSRVNTSLDDLPDASTPSEAKVPVNEDYLFDVDIDTRELAPAYWLGPIYEVRRGTWFYPESGGLRPCDENLATQLEEGYVRTKPWRAETTLPSRSSSQSSKRPLSWRAQDASTGASAPPATKNAPAASAAKADGTSDPPKETLPDPLASTAAATSTTVSGTSTPQRPPLQTHRLFGAHMNSVVTYQDATVAWLVTDDFLSRMSSTMYQRFAGGAHFGGIKVVRGFVDANDSKESRPATASTTTDAAGKVRDESTSDHISGADDADGTQPTTEGISAEKQVNIESDTKRSDLERRMATIVNSPGLPDHAAQEEEIRMRQETEMREDYRETDEEEQGREIEHLLLVTHGIGQRLGFKMESLNFVHDVNVLRKTLKSVYANSPDLQALNMEVDKLPKNCRVQVLPIVWRHLLEFPKHNMKSQRKEHDLSDGDALSEILEYPRLSDITVDGVPAIRNLVEDLFLDILLYQSAYRDYIAGIIQKECNRVHGLFRKRNPDFHGKVSLVGHSLGSALMFDLLCRQKSEPRPQSSSYTHKRTRSRTASIKSKDHIELGALDFDVEDFYCLGSPIGLFQMIKGRTIAGRQSSTHTIPENEGDADFLDDKYFRSGSISGMPDPLSLITTATPRCAQLFNIFHPSDPVAYRLEPLISPAMKTLRPQPLPYVKRGIFGATGAGISGIGARVGQSVSGFWSNFTTGVANSLLNRSLGLSTDGQPTSAQTRQPLSMNAGAHLVANQGEVSTKEGPGERPETLIDADLETLYSGFQRRRQDGGASGGHSPSGGATSDEIPPNTPEWQEAETKARQLRSEEAKVRALNSTGRVDFSIQEGVFDISLIASIASHLSYWADEDVSHFMISQLLSRQRTLKRSGP